MEGGVKASITGSIIGNMLLVLGLLLIAGGAKYKTQSFERTAGCTSATALMLAAFALLIQIIFHLVAAQVPVASGGWTPAKEQNLSLAIAIFLFLAYLGTLYLSLVTHKNLFVGEAVQGGTAFGGLHDSRHSVLLSAGRASRRTDGGALKIVKG